MLINSIRILLGVLFIVSGSFKLFDLTTFNEAITKFDLVSRSAEPLLTILIPAAELVCGLALLTGTFKKGAVYGLLGLMLIFTFAIGTVLSQGITFSCDCFGPLKLAEEMSGWSIIFNVWIIGLLIYLAIKETSQVSFYQDTKIVLTLTMFVALLAKMPLDTKALETYVYTSHIKEISFQGTVEISANEEVLIVDARPKRKYDSEHFPDAISLPYDDFENNYQSFSIKDKTRKVFVYCETPT